MTEPKRGWFQKLTQGLSRSSKQMGEQITHAFVAKAPLDQAKLDELEEMLIEADLGPHSAARITQRFSDEKFGKSVGEQDIKEALAQAIGDEIGSPAPARVQALIAEGALGRKSGRGFYEY